MSFCEVGIVFDVDGVLFDVTNSFLMTIQKTFLYYQSLFWFSKNPTSVSLDDIYYLKSLGGFNDDWDLTAALLLLQAKTLEVIPGDLKRFFRKLQSQNFSQIDQLCRDYDSRYTLRYRDLFQEYLQKVPPKEGFEGVLDLCRNVSDIVSYQSEGLQLSQGNLVKRLFQEVYYGDYLCDIYGEDNLWFFGSGQCYREVPLITQENLASWSSFASVMGVFTGREYKDVQRSLCNHGWESFFSMIVALDDVLAHEKKPNPSGLLKIIKHYDTVSHWVYIGDQKDDFEVIQAVRKEGYSIIGCGFLSSLEQQRAYQSSYQLDWVGYDHQSLITFVKSYVNELEGVLR